MAAMGGTAENPGARSGRSSLTGWQSLSVGITLFSMFFGAGNLILPPLLGLRAGKDVVPALVGFLVAGIGLPLLGIVAVALCGTGRALAARVGRRFSRLFVAAVYLAIGPLLAIPRTSSTAFEMLAPMLGGAVPVEAARLAFSVVFFAIAFALALHPGRLTGLLGRVTGPALIALIVAVVLASVVSPAPPAAAAQAPYDSAPAVQGFLTGYQTMDLLASLTFGIVISANIKEMGVSAPGSVAREVSRAGLAAGGLMVLIYGGLAVVGVDLSPVMPQAANGATILTASATVHFGFAGTVLVAAIFLLACLNVCIGLISCCGSYFADELPRVSYRMWALAFALFSCAVSDIGLDAILAFSVPLLNALYPMAIVLVLLGTAHRLFDRVPLVWPCSVGAAGAVSVVSSLRDALASGLWLPVDALPLSGLGFAWVFPAVLAGCAGAVLSLARRRRA